MTQADDDALRALQAAVKTIWIECGEMPPIGDELQRAALNLRHALASGRRIGRQVDKTLQPMAARRDDIERAALEPTASARDARASIASTPPPPPSTTRE